MFGVLGPQREHVPRRREVMHADGYHLGVAIAVVNAPHVRIHEVDAVAYMLVDVRDVRATGACETLHISAHRSRTEPLSLRGAQPGQRVLQVVAELVVDELPTDARTDLNAARVRRR